MTYEVIKYIKGNPYRYLVKSVRDGDRVRQVFVRYLGRADKPSREYVDTEPVERKERIRRPAVAAVAEVVVPTVAVEAETPAPVERTGQEMRAIRDRLQGERMGWQVPQSEFISIESEVSGSPITPEFTESIIDTHKNLVQRAIREGEDVPSEVLKDYPELAPTPTPPVEAKPIPPITPDVTKEPWQMTREEYTESARQWRAENMPRLKGTALEAELAKVTEGHKELVRNAIGQGKPVPSEVLKGYPDLKARVTPPVTPEVTKLETIRSVWLETARGKRYSELKEMYGVRLPKETTEYRKLEQEFLELGMSPKEKVAWRGERRRLEAEDMAMEREAELAEMAEVTPPVTPEITKQFEVTFANKETGERQSVTVRAKDEMEATPIAREQLKLDKTKWVAEKTTIPKAEVAPVTPEVTAKILRATPNLGNKSFTVEQSDAIQSALLALDNLPDGRAFRQALEISPVASGSSHALARSTRNVEGIAIPHFIGEKIFLPVDNPAVTPDASALHEALHIYLGKYNKAFVVEELAIELLAPALRQGKPIPPEVLKDYPDLAKAIPTPEAVTPASALQQEYTNLIKQTERIAPHNPVVQKARAILNQITPENQRQSLIQIEALEDELKSIVPKAELPVAPEVTPSDIMEFSQIKSPKEYHDWIQQQNVDLPYANFLRDIGKITEDPRYNYKEGEEIWLNEVGRNEIIKKAVQAYDSGIIDKAELQGFIDEFYEKQELTIDELIGYHKGTYKPSAIPQADKPMSTEEIDTIMDEYFAVKPSAAPAVEPAMPEAVTPPVTPEVTKPTETVLMEGVKPLGEGDIASGWQKTYRGRMIFKGDVSLENAKESLVYDKIANAPSYNKLLSAYKRHLKSLYSAGDPWMDARIQEIERQPWELLTAHAGVMNAKSARAITLKKLADAVFAEANLPRLPEGKFRGESGLDWDKVKPTATVTPPVTPEVTKPEGSLIARYTETKMSPETGLDTEYSTEYRIVERPEGAGAEWMGNPYGIIRITSKGGIETSRGLLEVGMSEDAVIKALPYETSYKKAEKFGLAKTEYEKYEKELLEKEQAKEAARQAERAGYERYQQAVKDLGSIKGVKKTDITYFSPIDNSEQTREGFDVGQGVGIVIHEIGKGREYAVTHINTGLAMGHTWKNRAEAVALAKSVAGITDWSKYNNEKEIPQDVMSEAAELVRGFTQKNLEESQTPTTEVKAKREYLTFEQNVAKAVEERPSRISHGYTSKNAFYVTKDNRIVPANEFSKLSKTDDVISVHSHSGENWERYTREHGQESFQPPNAADFDHLRWLIKRGYGNKLAVIMGDGRYIQVEIPKSAQPRFARMGIKSLEKLLYPESRGASDAEHLAKLKDASKEEGWLLTEGNWKD